MKLHCGHGLPARPIVRRAGQDLELRDRRRALAMGGAEAVGAGVAAADDHDVLAVDVDRRRRRGRPAARGSTSGRYSIA